MRKKEGGKEIESWTWGCGYGEAQFAECGHIGLKGNRG